MNIPIRGSQGWIQAWTGTVSVNGFQASTSAWNVTKKGLSRHLSCTLVTTACIFFGGRTIGSLRQQNESGIPKWLRQVKENFLGSSKPRWKKIRSTKMKIARILTCRRGRINCCLMFSKIHSGRTGIQTLIKFSMLSYSRQVQELKRNRTLSIKPLLH